MGLKVSRRLNRAPLFIDSALIEVIRAWNFTTPIFQYAKMENIACIWNFVVYNLKQFQRLLQKQSRVF